MLNGQNQNTLQFQGTLDCVKSIEVTRQMLIFNIIKPIWAKIADATAAIKEPIIHLTLPGLIKM